MSTATRPPTPALDPVLVEVVGSAFSTIVEEMSETLVKAAVSPNIKERGDCSTAVFDAIGNVVALPQRVPIHPYRSAVRDRR